MKFFTFFKLENPEECNFFWALSKFSPTNHRNHSRNMQKSEKKPKNSNIFRLRRAKQSKRALKKTFNYQKFYILQKQIKTLIHALSLVGNGGAAIRTALFTIIHIKSKKNRRENLSSWIDRKLNSEFRKNNKKVWKKSGSKNNWKRV